MKTRELEAEAEETANRKARSRTLSLVYSATPTMQFSLDRKRRSHKQNQCFASHSVGLIFTRSCRSTLLSTTTTPSLVKTRLRVVGFFTASPHSLLVSFPNLHNINKDPHAEDFRNKNRLLVVYHGLGSQYMWFLPLASLSQSCRALSSWAQSENAPCYVSCRVQKEYSDC